MEVYVVVGVCILVVLTIAAVSWRLLKRLRYRNHPPYIEYNDDIAGVYVFENARTISIYNRYRFKKIDGKWKYERPHSTLSYIVIGVLIYIGGIIFVIKDNENSNLSIWEIIIWPIVFTSLYAAVCLFAPVEAHNVLKKDLKEKNIYL